MSVASMTEAEKKSILRVGILTLRRLGSRVHAISWSSKPAKRVVRSASSAELLAATDVNDEVIYFKYVLEEIQVSRRTKLIVDSKVNYHLRSTYKEPLDARNKVILTLIREEKHPISVGTIRCVPGRSYREDAITIDNMEVAKF